MRETTSPPTDEWGQLRNGRSEFAPPVDDRDGIDELAQMVGVSEFDRRLECLRLATETAKHTGAYGAITAAQRYYRFATGQSVEDETASLTFKQRLDALTREFLREEKSDQRKMLHELEEYVISYRAAFGPMDNMPDQDVSGLVNVILANQPIDNDPMR